MQSHPTSASAPDVQSDAPSTVRLVIRVKLGAEAPSKAPVRRRMNTGVRLLILGAVAVLLSWLGIRMFRTDPAPAPVAIDRAPDMITEAPRPKPAVETAAAERRAIEAKSVAADARAQQNTAPLPIDAVIPDVPRSALDTIRGTIRVSVRVILDKDGSVLAATADEPGPSRYFERLALEASRKWTFAPTDADVQRVMLVRFHFTREGATARASSLP